MRDVRREGREGMGLRRGVAGRDIRDVKERKGNESKDENVTGRSGRST